MGRPSHNHALDGQSRFGEIVAILSVGCALSTFAVLLRCYTRLRILRTFGPDDALMALAQLLNIGSAVAIGLEARWGLGRHVWTIPEENVIPYMKAFYSSVVVYNVAVCLVKISILLQYRRIFTGRTMQRLTLYGLCFLSAWTVTLAFLLSLVCVPVAAFWDKTVEGRCLDSLTIWYVMAGVNLVTDFAIFTMPLPVVKDLQLPKRQKIMLSGVFGLGFFTCAISIYRIQTLRVAAKTTDPSWDNVNAATWSFLEVTIAVLAACIPTLRPILMAIMPRLFGASLSGSGGGRRDRSSQYPHSNDATWPSSQAKRATLRDSVMKHSDSTEGLRPVGEDDFAMRDIECRPEVPAGVYSVAVTARSYGDHGNGELAGTGGGGCLDEKVGIGGIKTTTVITQQVTFDADVRNGLKTPCHKESNP